MSNSSVKSNNTKAVDETKWIPLPLSDAFVVEPDPSRYGPYPYSGLQAFAFAIIAFMVLLSLIVCGLRVVSCRLGKGFWVDDWMIFVAVILSVAQGVMSGFTVRTGYWGIHTPEVPSPLPDNLGDFWMFINELLYNIMFGLIKVSALLFLLRIGGTKQRVRIACWVIITINVLQMICFLVLAIIQCLPVGTLWVIPTAAKSKSGQCLQRRIYSISQAVVNMITDILTLMVPFWIFLDLKVNRRVRNALLGVFMLGTVVNIISGVRLYYTIRMYYLKPSDRNYSIGFVTTCVELNLAIVAASAPSLWPLARRWFPGVFASLGISRPYLYPDIEIGYATKQSSTSGRTVGKKLRGKVVWQKNRHVPSGVVAGDGHGSGLSLVDLRDRDPGVYVGGDRGIRAPADKNDRWEDYGDDVFVTAKSGQLRHE